MDIRKLVTAALEVGNDHYADFEINDKDFTIAVYKHGDTSSYHLWTRNGTDSLCSVEGVTDDKKDEVIDAIAKCINDLLEGYIHCSDCGVEFPYVEVQGYKRSYFAGKYCQHCWDTKWKVIEASETYD